MSLFLRPILEWLEVYTIKYYISCYSKNNYDIISHAGLLSAHLLSHKAGKDWLEPGWPCNGPLLRLAEDAATRLLPAFNSSTGMPYGTVNLREFQIERFYSV